MEEKWTTHIKSKTGWFDIDLKELYKYRDLIYLFVKRNYATRYKQTILGPLWLILNPLITVLLYSFVFGSIAGLSTDGCPQLIFYMASNTIWSYFALALNQTATTFTANAAVFGKVYFPRMTTPIASVLTGMLDLFIQIAMLIVIMIAYSFNGYSVFISGWLIAVPLIIIQMALLGLGCGIIISSLTTKYRDLAVLITFGIQLWMYASPVVYTVSTIPEKWQNLYLFNPIAPIITVWRYALLGVGEVPLEAWAISWIVTIAIVGIGVILFNHVEKTFMDTV